MRMNDSEKSMRWTNEAWSYIWRIENKEKKNSERDGFLAFEEKERLKDQIQVSLI